jgi:hypothetical protein
MHAVELELGAGVVRAAVDLARRQLPSDASASDPSGIACFQDADIADCSYCAAAVK